MSEDLSKPQPDNPEQPEGKAGSLAEDLRELWELLVGRRPDDTFGC